MSNRLELASIALWLVSAQKRDQAERLSQRLGVGIVEEEPSPEQYVLRLTDGGLAFRGPTSTGVATLQMDYHLDPLWRRFQQARQKDSLLRRAAKGQGKLPAMVFDATAGLCRDAISFAAMGCSVNAYEQSPLVLALVEDSIDRAKERSPAFAQFAPLLNLREGDCRTQMVQEVDDGVKPDLVYLDPMFPDRDKSASVKKEMALLHSFLKPPPDGKALLESAMATGARRILVKRPKSAPPLAGGFVHQFSGKSVRFDLYLKSSFVSVSENDT